MTRTEPKDAWRLADELVELARTDTAYGDLFLQRARELLAPELSEAQYAALEDADAELASVTDRVGHAVERGDWQQVRELTGRAAGLKRAASERGPVRSVAARVYGFDEVPVDPFSPGMSGLAGVLERDLPQLREAAVKRLERLRAADPPWAELYEARRKAIGGLELAAAAAAADDGSTSLASLRARAHKAHVDGDLDLLQRLSTQIMEAEAKEGGGGRGARETARAAAELLEPFSKEVCDRAARLGLAAHRVESTAEQVAERFSPTWSPAPPGDRGGGSVRLTVSVPSDAPEALRDTLGLLMSRPFVTSAGTRYMPRFVAEDVLVEDFPDPPPGGAPASAPLLDALGLSRRSGLPRKGIEKALRERGGVVVKDLGLDPRTHRLACIPVDVYTRLGRKLGWGRTETWTHLDGYMASRERKLMALAGGDVRFGGLNDLVAVGSDYDSERLLLRLALVQRRRFATW
jgi:hypothetical protein